MDLIFDFLDASAFLIGCALSGSVEVVKDTGVNDYSAFAFLQGREDPSGDSAEHNKGFPRHYSSVSLLARKGRRSTMLLNRGRLEGRTAFMPKAVMIKQKY
jgi:hypothetical protein